MGVSLPAIARLKGEHNESMDRLSQKWPEKWNAVHIRGDTRESKSHYCIYDVD